jgi:hypothetical protein
VPAKGSLRVLTTRMKAGYLRANGVPYSEKTVLTGGRYVRLTEISRIVHHRRDDKPSIAIRSRRCVIRSGPTRRSAGVISFRKVAAAVFLVGHGARARGVARRRHPLGLRSGRRGEGGADPGAGARTQMTVAGRTTLSGAMSATLDSARLRVANVTPNFGSPKANAEIACQELRR